MSTRLCSTCAGPPLPPSANGHASAAALAALLEAIGAAARAEGGKRRAEPLLRHVNEMRAEQRATAVGERAMMRAAA